MIRILGIDYMTDKEASDRYGYSKSWFQHRRCEHSGPKYIKMDGRGKVLYPIKDTDQWFKNHLKVFDDEN